MKRVCFFIDSLGSGGAQRQIVELAITFKNRNHNVDILIYHNVNFYEDILKQNNVNVVLVEEHNYILRLLRIGCHLMKSKYDVLVSFLESPSFIVTTVSLFKKKWKLIVGERSANPAILKSYRKKFLRLFYFKADYIVCNSNSNRQLLLKTYNRILSHKIKVIYNIVDFDKFKKRNVVDYSLISSQRKVLLIAASHQKLKNLEGLVKAVEILSPSLREQLSIVWYGRRGNDKSFEEGVRMIKEYDLEGVFSFFTEPVINIQDKYDKADAIGLFSLYEGLPNTLCEAMSMGKIVLASDVSDNKLMIDSMFLCDPYSPKSISKVLEEFLFMDNNQKLFFEQKNYEFAKKHFTRENIYNQYLEIMQ